MGHDGASHPLGEVHRSRS